MQPVLVEILVDAMIKDAIGVHHHHEVVGRNIYFDFFPLTVKASTITFLTVTLQGLALTL
jgi:hypothetical protein